MNPKVRKQASEIDIFIVFIRFSGLLGTLTGTLLCYLGVQAGHSFAHSTRIRRVCAHWIISGLICGSIGLLLCKGGRSDSWIPLNKNLWSLSFVLVLAGAAFIILTVLYLIVDVCKNKITFNLKLLVCLFIYQGTCSGRIVFLC